MATSPEYRDYILDLMAPIYPVRPRAMFGGVGVYVDDAMFGLMTKDDVLYFKVDAASKERYVSAEMSQFMHMPYYEVPQAVLESEETLRVWMEEAMEIGRRTKKKKKKKK